MRRFIELDLLRTLAIVSMIAYHTAFDLAYFYHWNINVYAGPWKMLATGTASLFLLLVGMSYAISGKSAMWKGAMRRFARIGSAALLVTIGTYLLVPDAYVRFGILHLIAVSSLILPLIRPLRWRAVLLGVIVMVIGQLLPFIQTDTWLLLPLGIVPASFQTVDYFPLFPWFGIILIGYGLGTMWYSSRAPSGSNRVLTMLSSPSRHALLLYLLHQPVILVILWTILGSW